ncbi:MAG: ABC transporter substrate-binding protein [Candidatus Omnitrophota bacterium]
MVKFRTLNIVLLIFLLMFFSINPVNAQKEKNKPKTLHFAISYAFNKDYDPLDRNIIQVQPFYSCIYSTLFRQDGDANPYPFLIEKYEHRGKTVVFYLKNNACFSDGSPITSDEVIHTIEAGMIHPTSPNTIYKIIEGGDKFFQKKKGHCPGIKKLNAKTFEIHFITENVDFASYFTPHKMCILPRERNKTKLLFSGPFQVDDYKETGRETIIKLKQNPWYIGKRCKIDYLYFHFYANPEDYNKAVELGEPDLFLDVLNSTMPVSKCKYNYFKTPGQRGFYLLLNAQKGPLKDKKLRTFLKYFTMSLDLAEIKGWGLTIPTQLTLPYGLTGYTVFKHIEKKDFKLSIPKKTIKIKCLNVGNGPRKPLFELLQKKLKKFNLNLDLEWEDSVNNILDRQKRGDDIDLTAFLYQVDIPVSCNFYETLFTPGHELNLFGYAVPEAIHLLDAYYRESSDIKRLKILARLEEIAQDEAILIPLVNPLYILGYKNRVKGVCLDRFVGICIGDIDVDQRH